MATQYRTPEQQQLDALHTRAWRNELLEAHGETPSPVYFSILGSDGPNLRLSDSCERGVHDICAGASVRTLPTGEWRCRCLCHHATRQDWLDYMAGIDAQRVPAPGLDVVCGYCGAAANEVCAADCATHWTEGAEREDRPLGAEPDDDYADPGREPVMSWEEQRDSGHPLA
jgi:hypothetical protein